MIRLQGSVKENTQDSPVKAGFSLIPVRFFVLLFTAMFLASVPFIGLFFSGSITLTLGLFVLIATVKYQNNSVSFRFSHMIEMDRVYNYGANTADIKKVRADFYKKYPKHKPVAKTVKKKANVIKPAKYSHSYNLVISKQI